MRAKRLHLVNYRRFEDASLDFPDGIVGVVGRNGAGKSTILESMLWCLFGHDAARTSKELLKRQDAAPGDDLVVRFEFDLDGAPFAVTRRLRGRTLQPEAAVESGDQILVAPGANSWDQANAFVTRLLGFDRPAFESTVVAKQGELAALSDLRPAERKRLLLGMLGIERIDDALHRVRTDARILEVRVQELRRSAESEPRLRAELVELEREAADLSARLTAATQEVTELRPKVQSGRAGADRLLEARGRDQEIRLRLHHLQSRLEAIWGQRTKLAAEQQLVRDREHQSDRLRHDLSGMQDLDAELGRSEQAAQAAHRRRELEERRGAVDEALARWRPQTDAHATNGSSPGHLEENVARLRRALDEDARRGAVLQVELEASAQELQAMGANGHSDPAPDDPCPTCGRPYGESLAETLRRRHEERETRQHHLHARVEQLRLERVALESRRATVLADAARAERKLEEVRRRVQRAALATDEVRRLEAERATLDERLATAPSAPWDQAAHARLLERRTQREALRLELARAEEAVARLPRLRDEDRILQAQEQAVFDERETISRELRQFGYEAGSWERAQAEAEALRARVETLERERAQLSERTQSRSRETMRFRTTLEDLAKRRTEAEQGAAELRILDLLGGRRADQGLLAEFRNHLVGRIRPALARHASLLLRQMTNGRYCEIVLDEDYSPRLVDEGVAHPLERFSGGERDLANLALRLAVSELVTNTRGRSRLQLVALDEIFGSLDEERRGAVLHSLHALSSVFRQVFVVTHLEDVRERLSHVVRVEHATERTSRFAPGWEQKA